MLVVELLIVSCHFTLLLGLETRVQDLLSILKVFLDFVHLVLLLRRVLRQLKLLVLLWLFHNSLDLLQRVLLGRALSVTLLLIGVDQRKLRLRVVTLISKAPLVHQMLSPASFAGSNILVAKRASVGLAGRFPRIARLSGHMLLVDIDVDAFPAPLAGLVLILVDAFLHQVIVQRAHFDDLATSSAGCQHQAVQNVMQVQFVRLSEVLVSYTTELARWSQFRNRRPLKPLGRRSLGALDKLLDSWIGYELLKLWDSFDHRAKDDRLCLGSKLFQVLKAKLVVKANHDLLRKQSDLAVLVLDCLV